MVAGHHHHLQHWHYSYWLTTGTFYNFYNYYDGTNAWVFTESETVVSTDTGEAEVSELVSDIKEEFEEIKDKEADNDEEAECDVKKTNSFITWLKERWLTTVIFVGAGITFLVIYLYNRNKNIIDGGNI